MIYDWLLEKYKDTLTFSVKGSHILGPVLALSPETVNIGPGCTLGHPSRDLLAQLLSSSPANRDSLISERPVVSLSKNTIIGPNNILYEGVELGSEIFVEGRSIIRRCAAIGNGCTVYFGAYIGENVVVGRDCKIGGFVCNGTIIGTNSAILGTLVHEYIRPGLKKVEPSPIIGDNVLVGMNATVVGGVRIGNNARIAAGAIVLKDVDENALIVGTHK